MAVTELRTAHASLGARMEKFRSRFAPEPEPAPNRPRGAQAVKWSIGVALVPWILSRMVVLLALSASRYMQGGKLQNAPSFEPNHSGLFAWDSGWYRDIAAHGYADLPQAALRFFPLQPLLGRLLADTGIPVDGAVLLVANAAALGYGAVLVWLVRVELGSPRIAKRAAWLLAFSPGAVVLSMAYAEPLAGLASVAFFLLMRRNRPWWAAAAGVAAGLARPVGVVLVGAAVLDLVLRRPESIAALLRRVPPVLGPIIGTGAYMTYVGVRFGDAFLPYSVTKNIYLHGPGFSNPFYALPSIHFPGRFDARFDVALVLVAIALCVVSAAVLPFSYTAWSAVMIFLSITSAGEYSLPRYLCAVFPLLITGAVLARTESQWAATLAFSATIFAVVAVLGFGPNYTL